MWSFGMPTAARLSTRTFLDMYVQQGQWVDQGEAIGGLGCTGYCTGTHLHFEVIIGGVKMDPLDYLP